MNVLTGAVTYSRFVLSERHAGRATGLRPSKRIHLGGVGEVLPAKNHYAKKVVVLIDELTISAVEFLAAILQDNNRAILFGRRTAGASGCVRRYTITNLLGDDLDPIHIILISTVGWRTNGQRIENIVVHPDVAYKGIGDISSGYAQYRHQLLATLGLDEVT